MTRKDRVVHVEQQDRAHLAGPGFAGRPCLDGIKIVQQHQRLSLGGGGGAPCGGGGTPCGGVPCGGGAPFGFGCGGSFICGFLIFGHLIFGCGGGGGGWPWGGGGSVCAAAAPVMKMPRLNRMTRARLIVRFICTILVRRPPAARVRPVRTPHDEYQDNDYIRGSACGRPF